MSDRAAQVLRAAQLYYEQDLTQEEIARVLDTSRASVSRMLTEARATGVVNITIQRPIERDPALSEAVRRRLDLRDAIVVASELDYEASMKNVGVAAAEMFRSTLRNGQIIGISWGQTLSHMVDALDETILNRSEIVQMTGSLGEGDPQVDGPELARRLAGKLGTTYRYVHAPAVVESEELRDRLTRQPQIRQTLERSARADVCLVSVGAVDDDASSLQRAGYLDDDERRRYAEAGAVGHLLAKMIDIDGNEFPEYSDRVIAIPLETLTTRPWSICMAASARKAPAILGAIRGGYVNALVVDEDAARRLLELTDPD